MVNRYCECCHRLVGRPDAAANFYNAHFIPDRWELQYFQLSECSDISLMGYCKDCGGELEETIPLPEGLTGDDLLKAIYDTMQTAHPYDSFSKQVGYYGHCEERSRFYAGRDERRQFRPSEYDSRTHGRVLLTAYEFDFVPILNYGCEGIYIDCCLKGKFDESVRCSLHVGTLKTLRWDLESAKIMGELCGALMHHANGYINQNLHRYTPQKELEAEYRRQLEREAEKQDN